jgi:hypothetical protein
MGRDRIRLKREEGTCKRRIESEDWNEQEEKRILPEHAFGERMRRE